MPEMTLSLHISADEYLRFYQGQAKRVTAIASDGRRVMFPAEILKPYVTHEGISGTFKLMYNEQGKIIDIQRLKHS